MVVLSRISPVVALAGTAFLCAGACGSRSELYALGGPSSATLGGGSGEDDAGPDGGGPPACMGQPIDLAVNAPNLYFVLDHSTSMDEMDKWTNVRQVVAQLITQIGAGARFGAMMFPGVSVTDSCTVGTQVMALQQGDPQGVLANTFLNATSAAPLGGTPTAATLNSLVPTLSGLTGSTFAILATDGGPNCDTSITCPPDECTANIDGVPGCPTDFSVDCCQPPTGDPESCLDEANTVAAAGNLEAAGVKTFVLGIPGSSAYGNVLDEVAKAGGTARSTEPLYYRVDTADAAALAASFAEIVQQTGAGCSFTLAMPPTINEGLRAVLAGVTLPSSGPNRWSLQGVTLTLFGTSCTAVQTSGAPSLAFFDGCTG
jgi:hypothetical protein